MESRADEGTQRLIKERDLLLVEIEALRNKVSGLELAIALLEEGSPDQGTEKRVAKVAPAKGKVAKINVTETILELLRQAGPEGINARTAVERAERLSIDLNRSSISSLLSRLKRNGTVVYENTRYKLKEHAKRPERSPILVVPPREAVSARMAADGSS